MCNKGHTAEDGGKRSDEKRPVKDMDPNRSQLPEWSIVLLTAVIAGVMVWQTFLTIYRDTSATEQANRIIDEGKRLSGAGERSADAMEASVALAEEAMRLTLEESRKSLDATIEIARNDQRAWVGVITGEYTAPSAEGWLLKFDVNWKNSGKTPALNLQTRAALRHQKPGTKFVPDYGDLKEPSSRGTLQPNAIQHSLLSSALPKELTEAILTGGKTLYVFGDARYDDVFGRTHETTFAYRYERSNGTWVVHSTYNTAD